MEKTALENPAGQTFDGGVTEEQIGKWKQRYGKIVRIDVVDAPDLHIGYFHRPTLETLKAVIKMAKTDEVGAGEVLMKNCWLGGSEQLATDALLFAETQKQLGTMLQSCQSSLKNL